MNSSVFSAKERDKSIYVAVMQMKNIITHLLLALTLAAIICSFTACGTKNIPSLEDVSRYSEEELQQFANTVNEKSFIKSWGEPEIVNGQRIWTAPLDGGCKYITVWIENGKVTSLAVSQSLFVTVVDSQETAVFGLVDYNNYTKDTSTMTFLPDYDFFGNKIHYEIGDLFYFEFDGMIMETYPAQINYPYSATLMGHLTDDEINELIEKVVLP